MNHSTNIRQIVLTAALAVFALLAGPVRAAESGSQRYIVILKSRSGPAPDLAHLGGTVTFRQDDEVIVTLPPSALPSLKADPLVRYIQSLAGTDPGAAPLAGEPAEPTAGAPRRFVPHPMAGNLSWSRQYQYDDAGNIMNIDNAADTTTSQQFVYDSLGRLSKMATGGVANDTEQYGYDRYGNQTSRVTSGVTQTMNAEPTTNRLTTTGYNYDAAGNVTSGDGYAFTYDALGQTAAKTYTASNNVVFSETYIYTAGDERIGVQTSVSDNSSGNWLYWSVRDEGGKVLRQYRSSATDPTQAALWIEDYVYRDGQLVGAERPPTLGGRRHFHLDHLGSPRLITSDAGLVISTHDYLPFGGESSIVSQETSEGFDREDPMKFTGHERDYAGSFGREDGHAIDYMHARYYSPTAGRFLSVDPVLGDPARPQSWNRYAYVGNNPLNRIDPDGRADSGINLLWNRLKHIIDNHIDKNENLNKSKFAANNPKDVQKLVEKTVKPQNLVKTQADGRNVYEKTFNKTVGTEGENTVRAVTEPVSATSEKVITSFPTMNTLASVMNVVGVVDTAVKLYGYGQSFQSEYGRAPTFNESMRFMSTGDARSDAAVMLDAIRQVY